MPRHYHKERPDSFIKCERNKEIFRLREVERMDVKEVGSLFGLGRSRVYEIVRKMRYALETSKRLQTPSSEFERIEVLLHPNSLIINTLKDEGVETVADFRDLVNNIDNNTYGIPRLGERSLKKMKEVLKVLEEA